MDPIERKRDYNYVVHFRKKTLFSDGYYSCVVERDSPIATESDKDEVERLIKRKHMLAKCNFIYYKLIKAPYDDKSILDKIHKEIPF